MDAATSPARPTLRCLREDLTSDWGDASQYRAVVEDVPLNCALHDIDHPVVRHGAAVWPAGQSSLKDRESISGLSDPPYWKLKTGRWRGAVYLDPADGQPWIVAAGLRQAGSDADFYKRFMGAVASGLDMRPTDEDLRRLKMERAEARFATWELTVRDEAAAALAPAAANGSGTFEIRNVLGGAVLATVELVVEHVPSEDPDDAIVELLVSIEKKDRTAPAQFEHAEIVVLAALSPDEQLWDPCHTATANMYSMMMSQPDFNSMLITAGTRAPGETHPGHEAHWTHRDRLTEKSIVGEATRALCGVWFVPRQDPAELPPCERCTAVQRVLKQIRPST